MQKGNGAVIVILLVIAISTSVAGGYFLGRQSQTVRVNQTPLESLQSAKISLPSVPPSVASTQSEEYILKSTSDLPELAKVVTKWALDNGNPNPLITYDRNDGTYAHGNMGQTGSGGGAGWFAIKRPTGWEVVYVGQSPPSCSYNKVHNIPTDFVKCIED